MKVILATGSPGIDKQIKLSEKCTIVDNVGDLSELLDLLNYVTVDSLVVNRLLDDQEGVLLVKLAQAAKAKKINVVVLTDKIDSYEERQLISSLANLSVFVFMTFDNLSGKLIEESIFNYPERFDFSILAETIVKEKAVPVIEEIIVESIVNFHNKVITVIGNSELTAELSAVAAIHCKRNVCVIDIDFLDSALDSRLGFEGKHNGDQIFDSQRHILDNAGTIRLDKDSFERYCLQLRGVPAHVFYITYRHDNYKMFSGSRIDKLIDFTYRNYDLTFVNVNGSALDKLTIVAINCSDYAIISMRGDRISRRQGENYALYMQESCGVSRDKLRYLVFEYDESTDAPKGYFKANIPGELFLGYISRNEKRIRRRNSKVPFALKIRGKYLDEYLGILLMLGISGKRGARERFKEKKDLFFRLLKFKTRKLYRRVKWVKS